MRTLKLTLGIVAALLVMPERSAEAGHLHELRHVTHDYGDAVHLFEHRISRMRRVSDYTQRLAHRLDRAAHDLEDTIRWGNDARRVACAYDEVWVLHTRLQELLVQACIPEQQLLIGYWRPVAAQFERLVCEFEGCHSVCNLISYHPRRHTVDRGRHDPFGSPFGLSWLTIQGGPTGGISLRSSGLQFGVHTTDPFRQTPQQRGGHGVNRHRHDRHNEISRDRGPSMRRDNSPGVQRPGRGASNFGQSGLSGNARSLHDSQFSRSGSRGSSASNMHDQIMQHIKSRLRR